MPDRYPAGTGWWLGATTGAAIGILITALTGEVTLGLLALIATGTPFGLAIERRLETRPLTATERRLMFVLFAVGLGGFLAVWLLS